MFRVTRKEKRKPQVVSLSRDDDDDDQPTLVRPLLKKTKRRAAKVIRSFNDVTEEDSNQRRQGVGFGGRVTIPVLSDTDTPTTDADYEQAESSLIYDKGAMEMLKAEQKYRNIEKENPLIEVFDTSDQLPSVIPLGDTIIGENIILTGDDAMIYNEDNDNDNEYVINNSRDRELKEDTPEQWEEIARRTGIKVPLKNTRGFETTSIAVLKEQVRGSLEHLQHQHDDLQQILKRRLVEVNQVEEELNRQESEVKSAGEAIEYYQELRVDLSSWVGAFRDLKKKVTPLQVALRLVEKEFSDRWIGLEDDTVAVLREAGLLDRVLGRQPSIPHEAHVTSVVDEFGRDVKSQQVMAREKRTRVRQQIRRERETKGDESDALIAENERDELLQRRKALSEALNVATNELDDHYTSLVNLIAIFSRWSALHREEYKQCFAGMSLADLASVLVQVNLCSSHHPLHWIGNGFPWIKELHDISDVDDIVEESPMYRMIDKVLIPVVEDILQEQAYSLISTRQAQSLSNFVSEVSKLLPKQNVLIDKLYSRLLNYIQEGLQGIAIPVLKTGIPPSTLADVHDAINYATKSQVVRLEKILSNIMTCWGPVLGDKLAEPILDFLSNQFLFLLSSLQRRETAATAFGNVWKCLQTVDWLGQPQFMLQASPIRAAATVYL